MASADLPTEPVTRLVLSQPVYLSRSGVLFSAFLRSDCDWQIERIRLLFTRTCSIADRVHCVLHAKKDDHSSFVLLAINTGRRCPSSCLIESEITAATDCGCDALCEDRRQWWCWDRVPCRATHWELTLGCNNHWMCVLYGSRTELTLLIERGQVSTAWSFAMGKVLWLWK